ncbi:glycosyltransferase [candidate division WWE3 bacterium]|uniref:Glycosyltransferase n=1 Tax=candidate division WWE3 bacterium TaxID=2053526 RepID=A0A3A4ZCZ9_UNCKA|nr:MAG: glycosyltransferase [candidate division WWE3 bacterium]
MDSLAKIRDFYINKNNYYYTQLVKHINLLLNKKGSVLELGCGTGYVLNKLHGIAKTGIDISQEMIEISKEKYSGIEFVCTEKPETLGKKFEYIIVSDTLGYLSDIQEFLGTIKPLFERESRLIITIHNHIWNPILRLAESFKLKMPYVHENWLQQSEVINLLNLEEYQVISHSRKVLLPIYIPFVSNFINRYIAPLPIINWFCLIEIIVARLVPLQKDYSVSVIVPARNEEGNISKIINGVPNMGNGTELIFIEGNSSDKTYEAIQSESEKYLGEIDIKYFKQNGTGKKDAVYKGFEKATGEILMILDADATVKPAELKKFYAAISKGKGEFIYGSRLVYPMEKEAMQTLNQIANEAFASIFSWIFNQRITDTLCGTKVLFKSDWESLKSDIMSFGKNDPFGDFDLLFGAYKGNLKFLEIPIKYRARDYGNTNISRFKNGGDLLKMTFKAAGRIKFV